ncbi:MAG: SusF/SusE family outer membrane protein [Bacteroidales bacterium]|nr:SusF/SusE family outer membrane protein [Bacteroidales bacterium]
MKKYIKSTLLMLMSICLFTACCDDNDSNPTLTKPSTFVLNTPSVANSVVDLAHSSSIVLTCSQPDYGFPAATTYTVAVSTKEDMSNAVTLSTKSTLAKIDLDAQEIAAALTQMMVDEGKTEADFPMNIPVYFQAEAVINTTNGVELPLTKIKSNVVSLNKVELNFALPPVLLPENVYLIGDFCGWNWDKCVAMAPVYETDDTFWHLVYIGESGIKFNTAKAWDGGEVGFGGITIDPASELGDEIIDGGGNIASSTPGWYLMIVKIGLDGRDLTYTVTFNKPEVYLMGTVTQAADWSEKEAWALFEVPATADGEFISPAFANDAQMDGGVRAYVKVPGFDWWKSEFIVGLDGDKISYRGKGGDQERVGGSAGQKMYLNFTTDTGKIE